MHLSMPGRVTHSYPVLSPSPGQLYGLVSEQKYAQAQSRALNIVHLTSKKVQHLTVLATKSRVGIADNY